MDIMETIRARYSEISSVQKRIADYCLEHPDAASFQKLREFALQLREAKGGKKELQAMKTDMLGVVYRMLVLSMGEPVKEFTWAPKDATGKTIGEPKKYTPQSFYKTWIGEDLNADYVMLMNDPSREYWKVYEIDFDRHVYDGHNWLYASSSRSVRPI